MSEPSLHLSPDQLVRLAMARQTEDERLAAEAHAQGCARCRAELDDVARARERFRASVFPRTVDAVVRRGGAPPGWRRLLPPLGLAAALGTAAVVLLVALPVRPPDLLPKGAGTLSAFALRDGRVFPVADGEPLRPGDRVRFTVQGGGAAFALVASVDARRQVSVYHRSTALGEDPAATTELPDSILLDEALGPERIFAVFSGRPVPEAEVVAALATLGEGGPDGIRRERRLPLPYPQASLLIEKIDAPR